MVEYTFSYTTVAADIGKTIEGRVRTVDLNKVGGSIQLLADDWQVTAIPEPATLGLLGAFGGGILFIRRRFMI